MLRLGFIGTGSLVEAVIGSLQRGASRQHRFYVSPRSQTRSASLAAGYANVERASSNAEVVERSDILFLGMRPQQLDDALVGLRFSPDQVIVSFLANTPRSLIASKVSPATHICRVMPTNAVKYRRGPVVMYPRDEVVEDIFRELGDLIVVDRESDLTAVSQASAVMSSHFKLQNTVVEWLLSRGVAQSTAAAYVRSMFRGFAELTAETSRARELLIPEDYETKGGLNERGRRYLEEAGWFEHLTRTLDAIETHLVLKPSTVAGPMANGDESTAQSAATTENSCK